MSMVHVSDFDSLQGVGWWLLLFLKSFAVMLSALAVEQLLRKRTSAVVRHGILLFGFVGLMLLVIGSIVTEATRWNLRIPVLVNSVVNVGEGEREAVTSKPVSVPDTQPEVPRSTQAVSEGRPGGMAADVRVSPEGNVNVVSTAQPARERSPFFIATVWAMVAALFLTAHLFGYLFAIRRIWSQSSPAGEALLDEMETIKQQVGLSGSVKLRIAEEKISPLVLGSVSPVIVLPSGFTEMPARERRFILLHELHHVRRNDVVIGHFARVVGALFWFNPLLWVAARRLMRLQELACDEAVLDSSESAPSDYAEVLVSVAKQSRRTGYRGVIPMAGKSKLPERIDAILEGEVLPRKIRPVIRVVLALFCVVSFLAGLAQISEVKAKEEGEVVDPGKISDEDLAHLKAIAEMFERSAQFPSRLHFSGVVEKAQWRDSSQRLEEHPVPTRFSVWLNGDWDEPRYRVDFEPGVSMWTDGAAPWYIRNETQFSNGNGKHRAIEHSDIGARTPEIYRSGMESLPGMFAVFATAGRNGIGETLEEGRRSVLIREIQLRLKSGDLKSRISELRIVERCEAFPGENVVEVHLFLEGRSEKWWFDAERDYALRGWIREDTTDNQPRFRNRLKISKLVSIAGRRWFPGRAEASLEISSRGGETMQRRWKNKYQFETVRILDQLDDSFFTMEGIADSIKDKKVIVSEESRTVGGMIVDESGVLVPDVEVFLSVSTSDRKRKTITSKTDREGRWEATLPQKHTGEFYLQLSHPDYVTDRYSQNFRERTSQPYSALYEQTAKAVIKRGTTFSGKVIDYKGAPVAGAEIVMVRDRWGANFSDVRTDSEGQFSVPPFDADKLRHSNVYLTVQAKGHGPSLQILQPDFFKSKTPLVVALPQPTKLRLRIVDVSGEPVEGALVVADSWREQTRTLVFKQRTNEDGIVVWNNAPDDDISFDILGPDVTLRDCWVTPGEEEAVIVLRPAFSIRGKVVSSEDGRPVDQFRVTLGRKTRPGDSKPYWEENRATTHENGEFSRTGSHLGWLYSFRIEADGFEPYTTEEFEADRNDEEVSIVLRKL